MKNMMPSRHSAHWSSKQFSPEGLYGRLTSKTDSSQFQGPQITSTRDLGLGNKNVSYAMHIPRLRSGWSGSIPVTSLVYILRIWSIRMKPERGAGILKGN